MAVVLLRPAPDPGKRETAAIAATLVDFDGEAFTLDEYRGTPLVVNFWASWCPSCAAEMPAFESVYQEFKGEVEFVGINNKDNRQAALELAQSTGVTYRLAEDAGGEVFAALGGAGMPTTVFIDGSGGVVETVAGGLSGDQLAGLIEEHLEVTR
jgi:cytochrome c biogenesis protein CcmG/thiol:disulfide interchange protein DsbE